MERPLDSQQASTTYWTDDFNVEDEEKNNLLEKCENCQRRRHESQHRISRSWIWLTALNLVILCLTLLALFFNRRHTSDSEAIKRITGYSTSPLSSHTSPNTQQHQSLNPSPHP
jgi:hypothetical protein